MASKNVYHRRQVADSGSKACWICYKPSTTVLITPEQDDWFHICPSHLKDTRFAMAKDAAEMAERKRKEELEREIEAVKKEYEEKMRKKAAAKGARDKDEKKKDGEDGRDEKEKDEKIKELEEKKQREGAGKVGVDDGPRIFELQKSFFQQRLQKKRDAELARRNRERVKNPTFFPTVPTGDPI